MPASLLYFLICGQNQRKVYREVLTAGDLSEEDIRLVGATGWFFISGRAVSDTAEFVYDNDTIYFAQPSPSRFVPGGSGAGAFNQPAWVGQTGDTPNITLALTDRNTHKNDTGAILRYVPSAR